MASPVTGRAPVATPRGWSEFRAGAVDIIPLWLSTAPFGAVYAVNAHAAGLSAAQTLVMSLLVFAGAAQFAAAGLVASGAAAPTIVIATLIINLRHLLLGASLAPYLRRSRAGVKALLAFQLTDESYAISTRRFLAAGGSAAYMFGANLSLYLIWQLSTVAGIFVGALIPDPSAYGLDLVFPLTFICLLVPLLRERVSPLVAVLAGTLAIAGALTIPGRWYILIAGLVASALGAAVSARSSPAEGARADA